MILMLLQVRSQQLQCYTKHVQHSYVGICIMITINCSYVSNYYTQQATRGILAIAMLNITNTHLHVLLTI